MKTRLITALTTLGLLALVAAALDLSQGRLPLPIARVAEAAGCPPDVVFGCLLTGSGVHGWRVNNNTTAIDAAAIVGQITSTSPGSRSTGVRGINSATTVQGYGVYGSHAGGGHGVLGTTISGKGVYGSATSGTGVYGRHANATGADPGVLGETASTATYSGGVVGKATSASTSSQAAGVRGINAARGGTGTGVFGQHDGSGWGVYGTNGLGHVGGLATNTAGAYGVAWTGIGVHGLHSSPAGTNPGVLGETASTEAYAAGVSGKATYTGANQGSSGVHGYNASTANTGSGVFGQHAGSGWAVSARNGLGNIGGLATDTAGGIGETAGGIGLYGKHTAGTGANPGVLGETNSVTGQAAGVLGRINSANAQSLTAGVRGINSGTADRGDGVWGSHAGTGYGVRGTNATGNYGVLATDVAGVQGYAATRNGYGVWGDAGNGNSSVGVYGTTTNQYNNWAGYFGGDVRITHDLYVAGATYHSIDNPRDPANQYLNHAEVESSELMNIYNGNVTLDANGAAVVELPAWFEAVNGDFRYQLTAVGGAAPNLHVAERIKGNRFKIAGGTAGLEVSWQVTGARRDAYSRANPFQAETPKAEDERGFYVHPELFGQPEEKSVEWAHHGEQLRALRARQEAPPPATEPVPEHIAPAP